MMTISFHSVLIFLWWFEDDITLSDKNQEVNHSIEAVSCSSDLVCEKLDVKDQLHGRQILLKGHLAHDALSDKLLSESSNPREQSEGFPFKFCLIF